MDPVQQSALGQRLGVAARRDGGDPQQTGQIGDTGRAALPYQGQKSVVTFSCTLAHGGSPLVNRDVVARLARP